VVEPAAWCDECDQCRMGRENTCRNLKFLGTPGQGPGCLSEYIVMPEKSCFPTHDAITLEQGVLCEPFAIGVYTVDMSRAQKGAKVVILGSGPIGLSCMAAARAEGIEKIYMTDKIDERCAVARSAGAVWTGNPDKDDIVEAIREYEPLGVDIVYECAGQQRRHTENGACLLQHRQNSKKRDNDHQCQAAERPHAEGYRPDCFRKGECRFYDHPSLCI